MKCFVCVCVNVCVCKVVVNLMSENSGEACPASGSHLFKIRHLLAMGKVVVSEVGVLLLLQVTLLVVLMSTGTSSHVYSFRTR